MTEEKVEEREKGNVYKEGEEVKGGESEKTEIDKKEV